MSASWCVLIRAVEAQDSSRIPCKIPPDLQQRLQNNTDTQRSTLSGTSGNYLQWAGDFRIQGAISTTNSAGSSICASSNLIPETSIYKYYGPTTRATNTDFFGAPLLVMPELTKSYPNEGAYAQCSYFQTGPPPIALTAVNEIVLPVLTLPRSTTEDSPETTTSPSTSSSTTTARPGPSEVGQIPSQTSASRTADATTSSRPNGGGSAPPPRPSDDGEEQENIPDAPGSPSQDATTDTPPASNGQPTTTASSGGAPPVVAPPSDNDQEQDASSNVPVIPSQGATTNTPPAGDGQSNPSAPSASAPPVIALPTEPSSNDQSPPEAVVVGGSTTISAGGQAAAVSGTTFSVLPSAGGIIGIADGETRTLPLPLPTLAPAPGPISDFVRPVTFAGQQGFVVAGPTITQGGEGLVISGTTYTALPSGSGVVAISEAGSTTLQQPSQLLGFGINTLPGSEGGYLFTDQTLSVGGSAVVIAGTTYSALPQGSGIAVAASGSSNIVAVTEATNIPGLGDVEVLDQAGGVYVLGGSVTVSAGGTPVTISNTVYSALPSGFGVLVVADGAGDEFAPYIEQGVSGSDSDGEQGGSYIIGAELLSENGAGSATTVAGVVYSALPSGSGVLVVANGTSTTIAVSSTGDGGSDGSGRPTSTDSSDGSDSNESVVPFTGASSPGRYEGRLIGWAAYLGFLVMVGMCLVD